MAQDTTPAIIVYQGNSSNQTFSVPFDKGDYGAIKVAFVRRGLTNYEYNPTTYTVDGYLFAWALANTSPVQYYYTKINDSKVYNAQNKEVSGVTLTSMADSSAKFSNGKTGYRALTQDISFHSLVEWLGEPLTKNDWICIVRETQNNQPYVYPNNQKHIEGALDNLSRQIQELKAQSDISLKVDATFEQDARKLNPIDWMNTIARSTDGTARGFRFRDFWLEFSTDDPNKAEADKTWTRLLNTTNVTTVREYYDKEKDIRYPEYSTDGGKTWKMLGLVHMIDDLQGQIDDINEDKQSIHEDINEINSNVASLFNKTAVNASDINSLEQTDVGYNNRISTNEHDIADLKSTKLDKNQGKVHSGKTMMVDENGYVVPKASTEDSGLRAVSHDNSMDGAGTDEDPLRLAETISGNRTFKDGVKIKGSVEAETVVKTPKLNNGADISVPTVGGTLARTEDIDSKITNCITKIPQDIKLELNNGTLTLKAGSIVYVPNGAGVFNKRTATTDVTTQNLSSYSNGQYLVFDNSDLAGTSLRCNLISACHSGTTAPTTGTVWYDTTNNKIMVASGSTWTGGRTLPLGIVTISNGAITSIDQVFNGFGYIGSTIFTLPGVKGLMPDGINADGTLRNSLITTVISTGQVPDKRTNQPIIVTRNGQIRTWGGIFNYDTTINRVVSSQGSQNIFLAGTYSSDSSGIITSFKPKTAFHAVDYSDFESLSETVEINDNNAVHKTANETIDGIKTFLSTIGTGAGTGIAIAGTDYSYTMRSAGATPNGCGLFLNNNASHPAFLATDTKITVGGGNIVPFAVTPPSTDDSTRIATTAWSNAKFLPLAGGTMNGTITSTVINGMKKNVDNSYLEFYGGTSSSNAAFLRLDGKDGSGAGQFILATSGGSSARKTLNGKPNGVLQWNNQNVATVTHESFGKNGCVKLNNGLIIQWGHIAAEAASTNGSVTFPTAFTSTNAVVSIHHTGVNNAKLVRPVDITTTGFKYQNDTFGSANPSVGKVWIAIGY